MKLPDRSKRDTTLGLAILADVRRSVRALGGWVALLGADAAGSFEDAGLCTLGLAVTIATG